MHRYVLSVHRHGQEEPAVSDISLIPQKDFIMNISRRIRRYVLWTVALIVCGAVSLPAQELPDKTVNPVGTVEQGDLREAQAMLGRGKAAFIANRGQIRDSEGKVRHDVRYVANVGAMTVYFMNDRICYVLTDPKALEELQEAGKPHETPADKPDVAKQVPVFRFDMKLLGTRKDVTIRGEEKSTGVHNYYTGTSELLQTEAFRKIIYTNVYDGVDLVYHITDKGLKYDFIVHPGGDYRTIHWQYEGTDGVALSKQGTVQVKTSLGMIEEDIPLTYEVDGSRRTEITGAQFVLDGTQCRFHIEGVHPERTLVIDPSIVWATYYGAGASATSSIDECTSVATDDNDNVIVVGWTGSNIFPVYLGYQMASGGNEDAFVVKFNSAGVRQWATYYGGYNNDRAYSVAIGPNDSIYVAGLTNSTNLLVPYAFQPGNGGGYDAFIALFSPTGWLTWASYCGGSSDDFGSDVAVSSSNVPVFTGTTYSTNFPTLRALPGNSLNQTGTGPASDAFIVTASKSVQFYGSYFGGTNDDRGLGVVMDASNTVTFTGYTSSVNYPLTSAWQSTYGGGGRDAFVTQIIVPNYGAVIWNWSTYFGGSGDDVAEDISVVYPGYTFAIVGSSTSAAIGTAPACAWNTTGTYDAMVFLFDDNNGIPIGGRFFGGSGNDYGMDIARISGVVDEILIAGYTLSSNIPLREPFQSTMGVHEAFVARLDHSGCQLQWSTYYGTAASSEYAYGVCSDGQERTIVVGRADYDDLPIRDEYMGWSGTPDGFIAVFDETSGKLPTFIGGSKDDHAEDLAVDNSGNVYIAGWTKSLNLPVTTGAHQMTMAGTGKNLQDAFIAKFDAMGNQIWTTYYGGDRADVATGIAVSGSNVYVVGYTGSSGLGTPGTWLPTQAVTGGDDGFMAKFNSSGVRQWGTYIGGLEDDYVMDVAIDNSGNVVVTGYTRTDFPDTVFASAGAPQLWYGGGVFDGFVSKFNSTGNRIWSTFAGGSGDDRGYGICIEGGNRIVMVGGTSDGSAYPRYGGAVSYVGTNWDAVVTKYYSNGSSPWSLVYGGNDHDTAFAVAAQTSGLYGRIYVAGTTQNIGTQTFPVYPTSYGLTGNNDMFVVRLDSLGVRWRARVVDNSNGDDHADAVVAYGDGVIVAGQTASGNLVPNIIPSTAIQNSRSGTTDAVILALDQYLTYTDGTYFGGSGNEAGTGLAVDYKQRVVLGGWSSSSTFGSLYDNNWAFQTNKAGDDDAFIARFTLDMTKLAKQGDAEFLPGFIAAEQHYQCYPNPTSGLITLEGDVQPDAPLTVTVTDVLGHVVFSLEDRPANTRYERTIDVSHLATGTYLMTIRSGTLPAAGLTFIKQ